MVVLSEAEQFIWLYYPRSMYHLVHFVAMVSRLTQQKGANLIVDLLPEFNERNMQVVPLIRKIMLLHISPLDASGSPTASLRVVNCV